MAMNERLKITGEVSSSPEFGKEVSAFINDSVAKIKKTSKFISSPNNSLYGKDASKYVDLGDGVITSFQAEPVPEAEGRNSDVILEIIRTSKTPSEEIRGFFSLALTKDGKGFSSVGASVKDGSGRTWLGQAALKKMSEELQSDSFAPTKSLS